VREDLLITWENKDKKVKGRRGGKTPFPSREGKRIGPSHELGIQWKCSARETNPPPKTNRGDKEGEGGYLHDVKRKSATGRKRIKKKKKGKVAKPREREEKKR